MYGTGSIKDPFRLKEELARGNRTLTSKALTSPRLQAGETTLVLLIAGQSLVANSSDSFYTPVHSGKVDNLSLLDGGTYAASDPLLGCDGDGGTWMGRCADKLIDAGVCARVILVPVACGGTSITLWEPGAMFSDRITIAARRCAAVGLVPNLVLWEQGQADHGMATATYKAKLESLIASARTAGLSAPWLIARSTMENNITDANIQAAQTAVLNGTDILAGANSDSLPATPYRRDQTHWNALGADAAANLWRNAIMAAIP